MFENVITSVGVILLLAISHAVGYKCLSCASIARPQDCDNVTTCGPHQKCFTQVLVSTTHYVRYNLGCLDDMKCATAQGPKRGSIKETKIEELQGNNDMVRDIDSQWDSSNMDIVICTSCCDTELCNIKGCGSAGLPVDSGPVCYSCNQETDPNTCSRIEYCGLGEACELSFKTVGVDIVFESGCVPRTECERNNILGVGAFQFVGRRRRKSEMTSRQRRRGFCNKCCTQNLCNADDCSTVTYVDILDSHHSNQQATNLPINTTIVNGGWNSWSHWNLCSVSCGGGYHYRVRVCNSPAPANGGAMCSGPNRETQSCNDQLCAVNGGWNGWSRWNLCSVSCGGGQHYRVRVCNSPAPANGGTMCNGPNRETQSCNDQLCAADGQWSLWTTWGVCSQTCGTGGIRSRQRNCDNPTPTAGGKYCVGQPFEIQQCAGLNDPHVIQSARNFTKPAGSQVVLPCLVLGSTEQAQTPNIVWTAPQVIGHPFPTNVAQLRNGALYIDGMTVDNVGPYFCTVITACGTYDSPTFWVFIA